MRKSIHQILPHPQRFRAAATLGRLGKLVQPVLPEFLKAPLRLLPDVLPQAQPLPEVIPAVGQKRGTVAMLAGCAQQVLKPNFNSATVRLLTQNGIEVHVPKGQGCCGAAAMHAGERQQALGFARQNLQAFAGYDAVISNAAGCGAGLKEYHILLHGEPEEHQAEAFSDKVKDISVYLVGLGVVPPKASKPLRVAYHDACHLAHAQKVKSEPRALLKACGVEVLEITEGDLCCGSAGTYNLEQPAMADTLGERKARHIASLQPDAVVTGNIGCHTQLQTHLSKLGYNIPIYHTVEFLDLVYQGKL